MFEQILLYIIVVTQLAGECEMVFILTEMKINIWKEI